jgi:hypothetical protein
MLHFNINMLIHPSLTAPENRPISPQPQVWRMSGKFSDGKRVKSIDRESPSHERENEHHEYATGIIRGLKSVSSFENLGKYFYSASLLF